MSKLTDAIKKIGDAIDDLMELKVQTVTGDVSAVLKTDDLEKLLDPDAATGTAKLNLVLETEIKFDGDSVNFIDVDKATQELITIHKEAVDAGLQHRKGLVEMFKDLLK